MNTFQGDPRIIINTNGAKLQFTGGQPLMDRGMENEVIIRLFSRMGWAGNEFIRDAGQKIGSRFEEAHENPITIDSFIDIEQAALDACNGMVSSGVAKSVTAEASNPSGKIIQTIVRVTSPDNVVFSVSVEKHGANWLAQALEPAYLKVTK